MKAKTYAYLMNDDSEKKKTKGTKKCVIKRRLMLYYTDCLFKDKSYCNHNKDLRVIITIYILKKSIRLH